MNTLKQISDMILDLKIDATDDYDYEILNRLYDQMYEVAMYEGGVSIDELEENIKQDDDVLEGVSEDHWLYDDVRNIQDLIIQTFGERDEISF